jgi:hypothetical protein
MVLWVSHNMSVPDRTRNRPVPEFLFTVRADVRATKTTPRTWYLACSRFWTSHKNQLLGRSAVRVPWSVFKSPKVDIDLLWSLYCRYISGNCMAIIIYQNEVIASRCSNIIWDKPMSEHTYLFRFRVPKLSEQEIWNLFCLFRFYVHQNSNKSSGTTLIKLMLTSLKIEVLWSPLQVRL